MTTKTMPRIDPQTAASSRPPSAAQLDPAIQRIIDTARAVPVQAPSRGAWFVAGSTALLMWAGFTPLDIGALGWVCLTPLLLLVRLKQRPRRMYSAIYVCGLVWSLTTLQWMRLGDPTMYVAWIALAFYVAIYFPVFVAVSRVAVHRFHVPMLAAIPVAWVGLEFLRGRLMTGFPWYFLGHTQHGWPEMIQISDIGGAYLVSFVVAMSAACLALLIPDSVFQKLRLLPPTAVVSTRSAFIVTRNPFTVVGVTLLVFVSALAYGMLRRHQADFRPGPRVALVQGNFTSEAKHDPDGWRDMLKQHVLLTGMAVPHQPDLIVWPETMFPWPDFQKDPNVSDDELRAMTPDVPWFQVHIDEWMQQWQSPETRQHLYDDARKANAALLIGLETRTASASGLQSFNSAAFVRPDIGYQGRYDKMHRVPFGEYIPLKEIFPWLTRLTPYGSQFGIAAGTRHAVFEYKDATFAPIICFEDTVPELVRHSAAAARQNGRPLDFFVNLTNDGWFHGSSELDQHLITAAFRAVECRTPMVRSVNTGISAIIDGDGVVREPKIFIDGDRQGRTSMTDPVTGRWHKQLNAVIIDYVPLDHRTSFYVATGDWFAGTCLFCVILVVLLNIVFRPSAVPQHTLAMPSVQ